MMRAASTSTIEQVRWQPPRGYPLEFEVLSIQDLRSRGSPAHFARPQRVEFHVLTAVTRGTCTHMIDFTMHECRAGTWLTLSPGQMQQYDFARPWNGWAIVFRPERLLPQRKNALVIESTIAGQLTGLPGAMYLAANEHALCTRIVRQMLADAASSAAVADRNALMQYQVYQLLLRLNLAHARQGAGSVATSASVQRVHALRHAMERDLRRHHHVRHYAALLGCTAKTLTRAAQEVTGMSAKTMLMQRIALEAKRLLVHTDLPVQVIADDLGFDESTNFVKFFRRVAATSPGAFRSRHAATQQEPTQTLAP